MNLFMNIAISN